MLARALISQSALKHNLSIVRKFSPNAKIVAMVKANGYGHRVDCIQTLLDNADLFGVSSLCEAEKLREKTSKPIVLLPGVYSQQELEQSINLNCDIVVHHTSQIKLVNQVKSKINVWLKLDTGMHRLGLSVEDFQSAFKQFSNNAYVNIACQMSHFACADTTDHPLNLIQLNKFLKTISPNYPRSIANSAAILSNVGSDFEFVRPGIMLYGASPIIDQDFNLKPVMKLSAPVISVKSIKAGESVGYGATWVANQDTQLAIIGIGYGDGYPRHAKNGTPVLINDTLCKLAGRVSMDLICVDIGDTSVKIGDRAILWGDAKLRVETIANYSDTISYELLTQVTQRVNFEIGL